MKNVKLTYQSYGSSILLFIEGETAADAHNEYLALFNWNGTPSEPTWVGDKIISCWSDLDRLHVCLIDRQINRLSQTAPKRTCPKTEKTKGGVLGEAERLARIEMDNVQHESYRSINSEYDFYEMGTICAEKPDESMMDFLIGRGFQTA